MATIKVACPKCGQKVSGDETFYGSTVECPICSADIYFPGLKREEKRPETIRPVPPEMVSEESLPRPLAPAEVKPVVKPEDAKTPPGGAAPVVRLETGLEAAGVDKEDLEDEPDLPPSPIWGAISIVSAVLSIVTCVGGILFAPIAIIFGHTALAKARHSPVQPAPGHTLGAIGLMIGYVSLVITILILLILTFFGDVIREAFPQITG